MVLLGPFAPEERDSVRAKLINYLTKIRSIECSHVWTPQAVHQLGRGTKNPKNMFTMVVIMYEKNRQGDRQSEVYPPHFMIIGIITIITMLILMML